MSVCVFIPNSFLLMNLVWLKGFGDTTSLMEAALVGSVQDLDRYLPKSRDLKTNFLGQSVLHLAILRPRILRKLISTYKTVDPPDKNGTTPLMYAAAYGNAQSALILLEHGADATIRDELRQRNFLDYALARDNWSCITTLLEHLKQRFELVTYRHGLTYIMQAYVINFPNRRFEKNHFQELLCMGADSNMVFYDGGTLLHHARDFDEVNALFQAGFKLINHPDNSGTTPLMRVVRLKNAALVEACLDKGASVNERDHKGWTALHHLAEELQDSSSAYFCDSSEADWYLLRHSELVETIRLLLRHGADPGAADHCVCACSLSGCTPSTVLLGRGRRSFLPGDGDLWSLEWLQILSELGSGITGEQMLLDLVRVKQFNEHELTHVCCQRGPYSCLDPDDIDEILDEENEVIQELDKLMRLHLEDGRGHIEERWIEQLSLSAISKGESMRGEKKSRGDTPTTNVSLYFAQFYGPS